MKFNIYIYLKKYSVGTSPLGLNMILGKTGNFESYLIDYRVAFLK